MICRGREDGIDNLGLCKSQRDVHKQRIVRKIEDWKEILVGK